MEGPERDALERKRRSLLRKLPPFEDVVRGSVVLMKRRCVYPHCCKCSAGEGHPTWVLTVSRQGKTHTVYLGKSRVAQAQRMVGNYRKLLALVREVAEVNLALLVGRTWERKGDDRDGKPEGT